MVKVSDIICALNEDLTYSEFRERLRNLITLKPKRYGGLTVDEWGQLKELPYIGIKTHAGDLFLNKNFMTIAIIKLLPDQDNHIRAHIGTEQPVPDNIKIKLHGNGSCYPRTGISQNIDWEYGKFVGWQIVGVAEDD